MLGLSQKSGGVSELQTKACESLDKPPVSIWKALSAFLHPISKRDQHHFTSEGKGSALESPKPLTHEYQEHPIWYPQLPDHTTQV